MKSGDSPKISFGIIVLNGEPFTRYSLRALYPFAHEIIVVEGASERAIDSATPDGHSTDGTLEILRRFKAEEDPDHKIQLIVRDGFWREKDEQSQAYAKLATGDYLWQVDIDEFYQPEDMARMIGILADAKISGASFYWNNFWGGFDYMADGWAYRDVLKISNGLPRLFRWGRGFRYVSHRPPTVLDEAGHDLRSSQWMGPQETAKSNIICYHYGMVFPKQALQKTRYYQNLWKGSNQMDQWYSDTFVHLRKRYHILHALHPPTWLTRFHGNHPPQIRQMIEDLRQGNIKLEQRPTEDIEALIHSRVYRMTCSVLDHLYQIASPVYQFIRSTPTYLRRVLPSPVRWPVRKFRALVRKLTAVPLESLPDAPDLFVIYRELNQNPYLKRAPGGWYYQGIFYPDYLTVGGASQAIFRTALQYCKGKGIDVGAGFWPLPGSNPIDLQRGDGLGKSLDDFEKESLDYVFSSHCLEHIEDWREALKQWLSKLHSGGVLFLYLPHPDCGIWQPGSPFVGGDHKWVPTPEKIRVTLQELGCDLISADDGPDAVYSFYVCVKKR